LASLTFLPLGNKDFQEEEFFPQVFRHTDQDLKYKTLGRENSLLFFT